MPGLAAYDEIADWYETEFVAAQPGLDPPGVDRALRTHLGPGSGPPSAVSLITRGDWR